jgi:hypothetical protein
MVENIVERGRVVLDLRGSDETLQGKVQYFEVGEESPSMNVKS